VSLLLLLLFNTQVLEPSFNLVLAPRTYSDGLILLASLQCNLKAEEAKGLKAGGAQYSKTLRSDKEASITQLIQCKQVCTGVHGTGARVEQVHGCARNSPWYAGH
jgi:hypothetical protein